jgi:hypothetical protein
MPLTDITHKWCGRCEQEKLVSEFYANKHYGLQSECKTCQHERKVAWAKANPERTREWSRHGHARRRFGLTLVEYEALTRNAVCEVCGGRDAKTGLDHDHETGEIRGVLCGRCNVSIGMAKDDPERLRALALYVERKRKVI